MRAYAEIGHREECVEGEPCTFDVLSGPFLPIDNRNDGRDGCAHARDRFCSLEHLPTGRGNVFDEHNHIVLADAALVHLGGPIVLLRVADEQAGEIGGHRRGRDQWDTSELCTSQQGGAVWDAFGEQASEGPQDVRLGREEVLVDVVRTGSSAPKGECTVQNGGFSNTTGDFGSIKHGLMVPCAPHTVRTGGEIPHMAGIISTTLKIGMEIHVELATRTKMFSRSANIAHPDNWEAPSNSLCDPVVLGLPGALPVMNIEAVEMSMMIGLALGGSVASYSKWDRKNYFYPDLPKGYQISQYDLPLCSGGALEIPAAAGGTTSIRITRAHLEEDTGKTGHELPGGLPYEGSLVDYNRAGVPLLEIVTEPDLTCAEDAVTFGKELRNLCRFLGVTEGVMQRGHMRFEPNINMIIELDDGRTVATPIAEIKNLNSFRAVQGAIEHESIRQVEAWKADGIEMGLGMKSTRGWDDQKQATFLQRAKEDAHDYRYFPEPDLIPVIVDDVWRDRVSERIPELPMQLRQRFKDSHGLSEKDARAIVDERDRCRFYEACVAEIESEDGGRQAAKWILNAGARLGNERKCDVHELGITPAQIAGIVALRASNAIGSSAAEDLFERLCDSDESAETVAESAGLLQVSDSGALNAWVAEAIEAQPQAAEDFAAGKDAAVGRLVGHVMKASGGQADAAAVRQCLVEQLRGG